MIKIEFKEAQFCGGFTYWFMICEDISFDKSKWDSFIFNQHFNFYGFNFYVPTYYFGYLSGGKLKSITPYITTEDPILDRGHILTQLGITKEQDEANQKEWQCK